ncbi:hypothetical protein JHK87_010565 [Glycine soja]|nr:hypothetical protein JHK87_010565 [Glycine soja]
MENKCEIKKIVFPVVTNYPVLVHILADLEILYTGLGRVAVTAATIDEFYNWAMFVLLIPFATHSEKPFVSVMLTMIFVIFCYPVAREITDKNEWDNYKLSYVFIGIMFCAHVTEMLGTHSIVGALIVSTVIATGFYRMPFRDGVALGALLNTKALLPLVMLNILQVTDRDLYTIMVTANVLMTILVSPIINYIYKPRKRFEKDKLRTIQNLRADADIPVMACVHKPTLRALQIFSQKFRRNKGTQTPVLRLSAPCPPTRQIHKDVYNIAEERHA